MNILVTGGAGFIGSNLVDAFVAAGHSTVVVDNLYMGRLENLNPKAKFYLLDIRAPEVAKVFEFEKIDVVCHQAAQMDVRKSVADPGFDAEVNVLGSLNLLQNSLKYGVKKFLFASTGGAIYGEQDYFPADEDHPTRPVSPYGVTKLTVEKYLFYYHQVHGLPYVALRYANVYGPRQNPHGEAGVVAIFTEKMLSGQKPVINGDGRQTRDFVYVGDVVEANLRALEYEKSDIFNIGTGIETDVNTIFHKLNQIIGSNTPECHGPPKDGEQLRSVIDYTKAKKLLGWEPKVDLQRGLQATVDYFRSSK
ncbi:UDP-glucose 4-epimerase [candidate division KSB1 bacterium]|nr:SDR family oxidoreductase [bacterium]RKY93102.1 MAG: UDP-glucose 4-epimerase [candidate division KSB1 bacterium]